MVAAAIRRAFVQPYRAHAGEIWLKATEQLCPWWPKLAVLVVESGHNVLAQMSFKRQPRSAKWAHRALMFCVPWWTNKSLIGKIMAGAYCRGDFGSTNLMVGRLAASAMASA